LDPFTGKWVANLAKSERHANHQFQSATLHFEVAGTTVSLTQSGVNMSGKHESSTQTFQADGQARVVAPGIEVISTWIGTHELETIGNRGDDVLGRGTYRVSPDGRTLTASISGIDASGAAFAQVIVFDRHDGDAA